jgi:leucine-zipper of insertion element IS481
LSRHAEKVRVSRQTFRMWLARLKAEALKGPEDRSHRSRRRSHQMPGQLKATSSAHESW